MIKISGSGQASSKADLVEESSIAPNTEVTLKPLFKNSSSVLFKFSSLTPFMKISAPSFAKSLAHAFPKPLLEAHIIAFFPEIPKSIC